MNIKLNACNNLVINNKYFTLEKIVYESSKLNLTFNNGENNPLVNIIFDWIHSVRFTDEGDLLKMQEEYGGELITGVYTLIKSEFIQWFNEQSCDIHSDENILHYLFVTPNEIIEVLSSEPPNFV